jgi:hypothetical protein
MRLKALLQQKKIITKTEKNELSKVEGLTRHMLPDGF